MIAASLASFFSPSKAACAQTALRETAIVKDNPPLEYRTTVWTIGLSQNKYALKSGEEASLLDSATVVQLGRGHLAENIYASYTFEIISGPYNSRQQGHVSTDFTGTGFSAMIAHTAENANIRTESGNYGFAIGLGYSDIIGRSVGLKPAVSSSENIDQFTMHVTSYTILPSLFFAWLKEVRPVGNTPELLATRIEGYVLNLGIAMPLWARYRISYLSTPMGASGALASPQSVTKNGYLGGYNLVITFSALLGV